jgi:hypothetical protein
MFKAVNRFRSESVSKSVLFGDRGWAAPVDEVSLDLFSFGMGADLALRRVASETDGRVPLIALDPWSAEAMYRLSFCFFLNLGCPTSTSRFPGAPGRVSSCFVADFVTCL